MPVDARRISSFPATYGQTARHPGSAVGDDRRHALVAARACRRGHADAADRRGESRARCSSRAARRARASSPCTPRSARRARALVRLQLAEGADSRRGGRRGGTRARRWRACRCSSRLLPKDTPRTGDIRVDGTVTLAVLGAALLVVAAVRDRSVLHAGRRDVRHLLRDGAATESRATRRTRGVMVAVEIALALVLTIGAGLMLRTLWRLQRVDPGIDVDRILTLRLQPTSSALQARPVRSSRTTTQVLARIGRDPRRHGGRRDPAPAVQRHRLVRRLRDRGAADSARRGPADGRLQDDHRRLLPRRRSAARSRDAAFTTADRDARRSRRSSSTRPSPGATSAARRRRSIAACAPATPAARGFRSPASSATCEPNRSTSRRIPQFYTVVTGAACRR